ncbi:MAG TPA: SoxR reducing system RseC family protein [Gallionellaceae bacterium]|nr:SoxR reducing system RseC family protein [Gallionellaceae bacterium]
MLETRAIVIRLEGEDALVEATQGGGCGHCDSEKGCGSGKLSQLFSMQPRRFRVRNEAQAQPGAEVQISVAEGVLLRSALLMYVLPLLLLLLGGALGGQLAREASAADGYAALGGALGLVLGFLLARWLAARQRGVAVARPVIVSCMSSSAACRH